MALHADTGRQPAAYATGQIRAVQLAALTTGLWTCRPGMQRKPAEISAVAMPAPGDKPACSRLLRLCNAFHGRAQDEPCTAELDQPLG